VAVEDVVEIDLEGEELEVAVAVAGGLIAGVALEKEDVDREDAADVIGVTIGVVIESKGVGDGVVAASRTRLQKVANTAAAWVAPTLADVRQSFKMFVDI
jgi:hypothetical protein